MKLQRKTALTTICAVAALGALCALCTSCAQEEKPKVPTIDLDLPVSVSTASTSSTATDSVPPTDDGAVPPDSTPPGDTQPMNEKGTTASKLNLRDSASPDGKVLDVIPKGTEITLTDINGDWYKVEYNGQTGFVSASYVDTTPSQAPTPDVKDKQDASGAEELHGTGEVTANSLKIRDSASSSGTSLAILKKGDEVTIVAKENGWYKIEYNKGFGYVSAEYVMLK